MSPFIAALMVLGLMIGTFLLIISRIGGSVGSDRWRKHLGFSAQVRGAVQTCGGSFVVKGRLAWTDDPEAYVCVLGMWWRIPLRFTGQRIINWAAMTKLVGADKA